MAYPFEDDPTVVVVLALLTVCESAETRCH
jgi:hypothetical protein